MSELLIPGRSLPWDLSWQGSVFLTLGLAASLALRGHAARAHRLLILAMIAAIGTPLLAQVIRHRGWGLLEASVATAADVPQRTAQPSNAGSPRVFGPGSSAPAAEVAQLGGLPGHSQSGFPSAFGQGGRPTQEVPASVPAIHSEPGSRAVSIHWSSIALGGWLLLAVLMALRFLASLLRGIAVVRDSARLDDGTLTEASGQAVRRLGLAMRPALRSSAWVRCPSVWCWSRRPTLLVPLGMSTADRSIDWVAIFCHELAHWQRRDHVSALFAELLVCALPWNPLAWWTRKRLGQLAEIACDDWVLASGAAGTDYAASLLELIPQHGPVLALAAVSHRGGLIGRLRHILDERRSNPRIGTRWAILTGAGMALAASAIALAQARPLIPAPEFSNSRPADDETSKKGDVMGHTLAGQILGPDDNPVANATVLWVGNRKPPVAYVALPRGDERSRNPDIATLARGQTDAQGKFQLSARFGEDELTRYNGIRSKLVVTAPGAGMFSRELSVKDEQSEVVVRLPEEAVVHGRLLTPAGQPARDVRVTLDGFHNEKEKTGMYVGLHDKDDAYPPYWPRSQRTDTGGRFTFQGIPRGALATLSFWHPDFAVDEVKVDTAEAGEITPSMKGFEIVPVKTTFTHSLEPPRPCRAG